LSRETGAIRGPLQLSRFRFESCSLSQPDRLLAPVFLTAGDGHETDIIG